MSGGVRVVYSDLDGTMLGPFGCFFRGPDAAPSLAPATALVDLLASEIALVLVSGRSHTQLLDACHVFGADGFVGELGAVLGHDRGGSVEVLTGELPAGHDGTPVEVLEREGIVGALLDRYAGRLEYHAPWHDGHVADLMLRGQVEPAEVERWLSDQGFGWLRMHDNGVLPHREMAAVDGAVHVYHLMPAGLSKGGGVAADLERRRLSATQAIAIGDSVSDLSMAPQVGRFFLTANGNASPPTADAASAYDNVTICTEANGHGWVEAVRWALHRRTQLQG
jgi:hydroxymethylpyrimidine pyrophosphatase-like HAD family hydrolase